MKKVIQIPGAPAPIGPYSQAILKGDTLYVSGQIPLNPFTGELVIDSIDAATERVMLNIEALLSEAGMNFNHIVKCSIFLKDMNDFAVMNGVYAGFFDDVARELDDIAHAQQISPVRPGHIPIRQLAPDQDRRLGDGGAGNDDLDARERPRYPAGRNRLSAVGGGVAAAEARQCPAGTPAHSGAQPPVRSDRPRTHRPRRDRTTRASLFDRDLFLQPSHRSGL